MEISVKTRQAYTEVNEFLQLLDNETRNQIPIKLQEFFEKEKDNTYHKKISTNVAIEEQNLKEETLAIIALLNFTYWCKDENERKRLQGVYNNNEKEYEKLLKEQYNPDNLFKPVNQKENTQLIKYKEPLRIRILNKIKKIFNKHK